MNRLEAQRRFAQRIHVGFDEIPEDVQSLIAVARGETQNEEFDYTMKL